MSLSLSDPKLAGSGVCFSPLFCLAGDSMSGLQIPASDEPE